MIEPGQECITRCDSDFYPQISISDRTRVLITANIHVRTEFLRDDDNETIARVVDGPYKGYIRWTSGHSIRELTPLELLALEAE